MLHEPNKLEPLDDKKPTKGEVEKKKVNLCIAFVSLDSYTYINKTLLKRLCKKFGTVFHENFFDVNNTLELLKKEDKTDEILLLIDILEEKLICNGYDVKKNEYAYLSTEVPDSQDIES